VQNPRIDEAEKLWRWNVESPQATSQLSSLSTATATLGGARYKLCFT
jgi:alkylation response protein AidB-like acyl-CoA dehydrogenase